MRIGLKIVIAFSVLTLPACDDEEHADLLGGGQGSSDLNNVIAGDGFCGPQGGSPALGQASFNSGLTTAKLDLDGNPLGQGQDPDWNPETTTYRRILIAVFVAVTIVVTVFPVAMVTVMFMVFVSVSFFGAIPLTIVPLITMMFVPFAVVSARYGYGELLR